MADLSISPMTELDAVNLMLLSIGQAPINTLQVTGLRDVSIAKLWLDHANRTVQSAGWTWNMDGAYELVPDANGFIQVPPSALSLEAHYKNKNWVMRKDPNDSLLKVYDKDNQTFVFPDADKPYLFNIVWIVDFESLPQSARNYITIRAGQFFQAKAIGSTVSFQFDNAMLNEALLSLTRIETRAKGANVFNQNPKASRNTRRGYISYLK